jgi:hypothetical protein
MRIAKIIYDSQGHTGNVYYARFVDDYDGKIWNDAAAAMQDLPEWADSAVALAEVGETGQFMVLIPDDLPLGRRYDVLVYKQASSAPENTDDVEMQDVLTNGGIFGF